MVDLVVAVLDAFATVFILFAVLWGFYNYREEIAVTSFWLTYLVAAASIGIYTALKSLEWAGVYPALLDEVQAFFWTMGITILVVTALVCVLSPIKRQIK